MRDIEYFILHIAIFGLSFALVRSEGEPLKDQERAFGSVKVVKYDPSSAVAAQTPITVGDVASQVLVGEIDSKDIRVSSVTFRDGARNRFHRHSGDQILIVVEGRGIVVTAETSIEVERGDVVVIPAGDLHWHGALPGETFTHLSIVSPHETTFEEPAGYVPPMLAESVFAR